MCICQGCGEKYMVDLLIPDDIWEIIKPAGKGKGAGLLCGKCIMERIEEISNYDCWHLIKLN